MKAENLKVAAGWAWPFATPYTGHYEEGQQFGMTKYDRTGKGDYFHSGFDFGSAIYGRSADIMAIHSGKVVFAGWDTVSGANLGAIIAVKNEKDGISCVYQEFSNSTSDIKCKVGDNVNAGTVIGHMSDIGASLGSHTHIGVTKHDWVEAFSHSFKDDGTWVDPIATIQNGISGNDTGDDDHSGDNNDNDNTPTVGKINLLKINRFQYPKRKKRYIQLMDESDADALPKYELIRKALNTFTKNYDWDTINYINSLQGEYGLEKLACAPYTVLTISNGKGTQKDFNLTNFRDQDKPFEIYVQGFLGKSNRLEIYLDSYLNYQNPMNGNYQTSPEAIYRKDAVIDTTPKNFDIFIDTEKNYEYQNQNRIKQSFDNASFQLSQNKIENANNERNFSLSQANQQQQLQIQQNGARQGLDITQKGQWANFGFEQAGNVFGVAKNLFTGNIGAAVAGTGQVAFAGLHQGVNQHFANESLANQQNTANAALSANQSTQKQTFYNSLTTNQLIASNNYENAVANINAGLKDIKNQPDITAVTGSDYNFEIGYLNDEIYSILYTTHPAALRSIAEFFAQFGYSINRYDKIDDYLRVRKRFNYVKTQGANIKGDIPNKWRNSLNLIFDNGITFWRDTNHMANNDITGNT
ncbi:peptidoglycan DD-metalloendopeptidase family protein [Enterococcus sp. DIV0240a]|uniref:M23 family metallopeptidase n=1 Tax=Enterococcus sp. DIV0240a TaxID=2774651 RepID=UPI003D2C4150